MRREILCPDCGKHSLPHQPASTTVTLLEAAEMAAEHTRRVSGRLLHSCCCDLCGRGLSVGEEAEAVSYWSDLGGIPYAPWESEYIASARGGAA